MNPKQALTFIFILCSLSLFSQTVQVTVLNGSEIRCKQDSIVEIEITPNPGLILDSIILYWEGGPDFVTIYPGEPLILEHTYPVSQFEAACAYGEGCLPGTNDGFCFQLAILVFYNDGPNENVQKTLTFQFPPRDGNGIIISPTTICAGETVSLESGICPSNDIDMSFWWEIENSSGGLDTSDQESTNQPYLISGTYYVTLTTENTCGINSITDTVEVLDPPQAQALLDSGYVLPPGPPPPNDSLYTICLNGGGIVKLNGEASPFATTYEWNVSPGSQGTDWNWVEGQNGPIGRLDFDAVGIYTITLTVDNACGQSNSASFIVEVLDGQSLILNDQPDACMSLNYQPSPLIDGAIYSINDNIIANEDFPLTLEAGHYIVTAELPDLGCGPQMRTDSFNVVNEQHVDIGIVDTTICSGSDPINIVVTPNLPTGGCKANEIPLSECVFNPADLPGDSFLITYSGECIVSDTGIINVIQTSDLSILLPSFTFCETDTNVFLSTNFPGGIWSGNGVVGAETGEFSPSLAGGGVHTITYEYDFITELGDTCSASTNEVVEIFPELSVSFQVDSCYGTTIAFDTILTSIGFSSITWHFGDGDSSNELNPIHTYDSSGIYSVGVEIEQNGGCSTSYQEEVNIEDLPVAQFSINQNVSCSLLLVDFINEAYIEGLEYFWDFGNDSTSTEPIPGSIEYWALDKDTTYSVRLTVSNGTCESVYEHEIEVAAALLQPDPPLTHSIIMRQDVSCYDGADARLQVVGMGGISPYQYTWPNGETSSTVENLTAGIYSVTITDAGNCEYVENIIVNQPEPLQAEFIVEEPKCFGDSGQIIVNNVWGGTPAQFPPHYFVSLSPDFDTLASIYQGLPTGTYLFYFKDVNGCIDSSQVQLGEPSDWDVHFDPDTIEILKGETILLEPEISAPGATFYWNPSGDFIDSSSLYVEVMPFQATIYTLDAVIGNCAKEANIQIFVDDSISVYIPNAFTPNNDGINDYFTVFSNFPAIKGIQTFTVVNKWGQTAFLKENIPVNLESEGWDGTFNGEPLPADNYAYHLVVECVDGNELKYDGVVKLIR